MYATLSIDSTAGELRCECIGVPMGATLSYQLIRHTKPIGEPVVSEDTSFAWDLSTLTRVGGDHHVQITLSINGEDAVIGTEWQYVPSVKSRQAYATWRATERPLAVTREPELRPEHEPFASIAVVWSAAEGPASGALAAGLRTVAAQANASVTSCSVSNSEHDPSSRAMQGSAVAARFSVLTSGAETHLSDGSRAFGSGYAFDDGVLRHGSDVANTLASAHDATDAPDAARFVSRACGDFAVAVVRPDGMVEFHTDYAGASAWFEYRSEHLHVVATSFLLAARIVQACGEEIRLNLATIDADFTSLTQGFQQPLLDELELAGFTALRPDTVRLLSADGRSTSQPSQLGEDLARPERFTVARYHELVAAAADELIGHCRAIGHDADITEIRCDISGGLDSRMVLAGMLASGPETATKVRLFTSDAPPTAGDEQVALLVAAATGVPFSDRPLTMIGPCTPQHIAQDHTSATFGTYWHGEHRDSAAWHPTMAHVSGSGLDNLGRDYSTTIWGLSATPVSDPREVSIGLARQVYKWRGRATIKPAPRAGLADIARSWDVLPGDEVEKGAQLFNFHRARFHGGGSIPARMGMWRIAPGPTRALYRLRLMTGGVITGAGLQLALVHAINPELAAVPYVKESYNETHRAMFGPLREDIEPDRTELDRTRAERAAGMRWDPCPTCEAHAGESDRETSLVDIVWGALHDLAGDAQLADLMLPAYRWAKMHLGTTFDMEHSYGKTFSNKVLQLHAMWRMTATT